MRAAQSAVPNALTIAGSDPSGGAGIQADLKTFSALGVYGCGVPAVLTAQNTIGITAIHAVPGAFLSQQLDAVFSDVEIAAVKIGMLGSLDAIRAVATALRRYRPRFVVLDPVLRASTGAALLEPEALDGLRDGLIPLATVITPNAGEAGLLLNVDAPRSVAQAADAAALLVARGAYAAVLTGGHLDTAGEVVDVLHDGQRAREFRLPRAAGGGGGRGGGDRHGTGCVFSSALTAHLALGADLATACARAQQFVAAAIAASDDLSVGRGAVPAHPLGDLWRMRQGRGSSDSR